MANVYIKTAEGGETTSPAGTEGIPLDDGENSTWISINNIAEYIRTLTQTLTNKTLTTPTIASFTNAQHDHSNAAGGGAISGGGGELANYLDNSGFYRWSRDTDGTFSKAMTDDAYNLPDRWYSLIQGANATLARDAGINGSVYGAKITAGGTTNRYGLAQIVKHQRAKKLRSQTVIFQVRVKPTNNAGSGSRDYRVAILEWTGTADSVTSEIVNDWTSSNYTTGNFFATTSLTLVGTATEAVSHNTEAVISVSGAVSASCNNLIVFVWAEDAPTHASDYAVFGEAGLYIASTEQTWVLPDPGADEANCMKRFISYGGGNAYDMVGIGMNYDTTSAILAVSLPVEMDANPTLAVSAANHWLVRIPGGSQTCTAVSLNVAGKKVLEILATVASGLTAGQGNELFANNTLSARLTLDCDL